MWFTRTVTRKTSWKQLRYLLFLCACLPTASRSAATSERPLNVLNDTKHWLERIHKAGKSLNLEGLWSTPFVDFLWEKLSVSPHHGSENPNDYAVLHGSGGCLMSHSVGFVGRFDPLTGILRPAGRVAQSTVTNFRLVALFLDQDPTAPGEDIPVPSFLYLTQKSDLNDWDPRHGGGVQWLSPFFEADDSASPVSTELVAIANSRFMYDPKALARTLEPSTLDILFPSDISFVEKHRGLFFKSHEDQVTSYLPAPELLQMYRPFIPIPVLQRFSRSATNASPLLLSE